MKRVKLNKAEVAELVGRFERAAQYLGDMADYRGPDEGITLEEAHDFIAEDISDDLAQLLWKVIKRHGGNVRVDEPLPPQIPDDYWPEGK